MRIKHTKNYGVYFQFFDQPDPEAPKTLVEDFDELSEALNYITLRYVTPPRPPRGPACAFILDSMGRVLHERQV